MEEKERKPYPQKKEAPGPDDPAMGGVYFGPQPIQQTMVPMNMGYAGPEYTGMIGFTNYQATPSDAEKPAASAECPVETAGAEYVVCSCGAKVKKGSKFCGNCGSPVIQ